jgi:hypothetical protein
MFEGADVFDGLPSNAPIGQLHPTITMALPPHQMSRGSIVALYNRLPKLTEYPRKVGGGVMSVEAGRIREHIEPCRSDGLRLLPEDSTRLVKCRSIGADAEDREYLWLILVYPAP